ncbi:hypothetical protein [Enterococcus termitis]|uniref:Uncharacterized protein n=1 Tax=Enterococcus termitis TaxID=332950 RepID=A0A1E5GCM9_9ENTE|nr:hypothetical protein [Enterococcus termitis]OEG10464.1 hypothetical protein BCR25_08270 [Enterococcus termitis]OJG97445.1 hypothetical protein RV18_GL000726 [Enterococcus termitis]
MKTKEELVKSAIAKLLTGDNKKLQLLKKQWEKAEFIIEDETDVVFFANIHLGNGSAIAIEGNMNFELGDVYGRTKESLFAVGFILYVRNGRISFFETYTFGDDKYPELDELNLVYSTGKKEIRDLKKLDKILCC